MKQVLRVFILILIIFSIANAPRYKEYNEKNDYDRTNNGFLYAKRKFKNLKIRISENDPELIQSSKYEVNFRRVASYDPEVTIDEKRYRSYLIHSVSRLFVFLSTDDYALSSKSVGANEFELLPLHENAVKNEQLPLILSEDDDVVTIRSSIGIVAQLSKETGEIIGF